MGAAWLLLFILVYWVRASGQFAVFEYSDLIPCERSRLGIDLRDLSDESDRYVRQ